MFGKKPEPSVSELLTKTEAFLQEVERVVDSEPKSAMKLIQKRAPEIETLIDLGGPLNERFANLVLKIKFRQDLKSRRPGVGLNFKNLPSVMVITDKEVNTLGQLIDAVQRIDKELIYLNYPDFYGGKLMYAVFIIEILYEFTVAPQSLLIYLDEVNLFSRRSFLLSAVPTLNREIKISKVPDELFRFAEKQPGVKFSDDIVTTFGYPLIKLYKTT